MFGFKRSMVQTVFLLTLALRSCTFGSAFLWYAYVASLLVAAVLTVLTYDHDYWRQRGVFSPRAWPLVGHIRTVVAFKEQGGMCFKRIYDTYKEKRFLGCHQFFQRTLVVCDPDLIKRICVNDFQYFTDRGFFFNKEVDPLAGSVLFLRGNEWKKLRAKISPIFSPNKLRGMFPLIENTSKEFIVRCTELLTNTKNKTNDGGVNGDIDTEGNEDNTAVVNSEKLVGGFTADAIVPCAFGVRSSVMDNPNDPFAVALQAFYEMSWYNIFEKTMRQFWPAFVLFFRMRIIPKKTHDFFYNIVTSVLRSREKGVQEKRGDFIDMMMMLRSDERNNNLSKVEVENDVEITDMVISANAFIIFLGGFETTSSTLAFLFLELAAHPEVQEKMRSEIRDVMDRHNGIMSYDVLQELTYTELVIQETLRLYPPFPSIQRMCTKDYTLPDTQVLVEKGTIVLFPTLGIQRDEQYFENAAAFVPERWAEGKPVPPPGVFMPFGDGPRYCIGKRFAMIQMKCCLVKFLQHVRISPVPGGAGAASARPQPFEADPRSPLTLHPADSRVRLGDKKMEVVDSDEEYLDDPIKLIDYEQYRFGMTAQGFDAFKEVLPNITQTYLSNQERLFGNFYDAYKCKPMSVQLVDCVKYHRYYKLKPIENIGRYQLQKTFKRKTIKKVSNLKQIAGNFNKAAVSSYMNKTNYAKKYTRRRNYGKNNEDSLKDVEIDACYSLSQLNQTCRHTPLAIQNKEVIDNGTEPSKLFNQNINSPEKLPVIEHVFSLNCSIDRNNLNNQYDYEDKRRLRNVIDLINLHRGTEKVEGSQISYSGACVESRSGIVMPRFTNNINVPEIQVKENMLHVIDIDTDDNNEPNKTKKRETNRNDNSEKEFDNHKEIDNFRDINKHRPSHDFKGFYKKSNINRIVAKYRSFTPLPSNCSSQSLNVVKPEVPYYQLHIPQVSRVFIQSSKSERNLSQRKVCSESATKNKVYIPCIYLKSVKNFSGVSSVYNFGNNRLMKDREITRNPEPGEVINNNLYRSNVSKGYSPPILPIPTYETLLDRFSQFWSRLLFTKSNVLPSLRTVLEESELIDV